MFWSSSLSSSVASNVGDKNSIIHDASFDEPLTLVDDQVGPAGIMVGIESVGTEGLRRKDI